MPKIENSSPPESQTLLHLVRLPGESVYRHFRFENPASQSEIDSGKWKPLTGTLATTSRVSVQG